jgi:hypothetical protein
MGGILTGFATGNGGIVYSWRTLQQKVMEELFKLSAVMAQQQEQEAIQTRWNNRDRNRRRCFINAGTGGTITIGTTKGSSSIGRSASTTN